MNPCPCGYFNDPNRDCTCSPSALHRYRNKISGPLLDRFDLQLEVVPVTFQELHRSEPEEDSATIRKRVIAAREIQQKRFAGSGTIHNGAMTAAQIQKFCQLDDECAGLMKDAFETMGLTARSYDRILKVARTVADMDGSEEIQPQHIAEAIQYRAVNLGNR